MKNKMMKRWMAGMCAVVLATLPTIGTVAADKEIKGDNTSDSTQVTATVADENSAPKYVVSIPDKVDFGTLYIPQSNAVNYKSTEITVKCVTATDLPTGSAVTVLVKDDNSTSSSTNFILEKDGDNAEKKLKYEMIRENGVNVATAENWHGNYGFLYHAFTAAGQSLTNTLRLDQGQLHTKEDEWLGSYSGTLSFYVKVANIGNVQ